MRAFCMIRSEPHYRRDAFMDGLKAAGYDARTGGPQGIEPGDVLVIWNRYDYWDQVATQFEQKGGIVVVAENGYLGPSGVSPHQMEPREWYALAIGGHNGSGTWNVGGPERWQALGVDLKPWRTEGEHILVLPNRSFGRPDLIMPMRWAEDVKARLGRVTKRPVRIRSHPGNDPKHKVPLAADLENAWAAVVWSSSAGLQALIRGIPVICEGSAWICKLAAVPQLREKAWEPLISSLEDVAREHCMHELAWAQWHVDEIRSGEAFRSLLRPARQAQIAAVA